MFFYLSLFCFSSSISFSPKLRKTQIWNLSWHSKPLQIKQTRLQLGTPPPTYVPRQGSRASTTESRNSSSKTSISRACSSHSLLWLSSEFSASSKIVSQVPFLTSPTWRLLSSSSSLIITSPASSRRQCLLFFDYTVSFYRTIIFSARFQYWSMIWPTSWRSSSRRTDFLILFPVWTSRICRTSTSPVTASPMKYNGLPKFFFW